MAKGAGKEIGPIEPRGLREKRDLSGPEMFSPDVAIYSEGGRIIKIQKLPVRGIIQNSEKADHFV